MGLRDLRLAISNRAAAQLLQRKEVLMSKIFNSLMLDTFNHKVEVEKGIMVEQCETILKDFFKMLRKLKK